MLLQRTGAGALPNGRATAPARVESVSVPVVASWPGAVA